MMAATRNLYTALIFEDRPDLHLTIGYYAKQTEDQEAKLIEDFVSFCAKNDHDQFPLNLDKGGMFGPRKTVPVMIPMSFPLLDWCVRMRQYMPNCLDDRYPFRPHVTMPHEYITLTVIGAGVFHKEQMLGWFWFKP